MKKYALVVDVPDIEESEGAYNHDRPISSLLLNQIRHLHAVEQHLPEKDRTGINITQLHTELDASTYIHKVTEAIHARGSKDIGTKTAAKKAVPKRAARKIQKANSKTAMSKKKRK